MYEDAIRQIVYRELPCYDVRDDDGVQDPTADKLIKALAEFVAKEVTDAHVSHYE